MRDYTRMALLSEDYGDTELVITDLDNNELEAILKEIENNLENGVGETSKESADRLFDDCIYDEMGTSDYLNDFKSVCVASYSCFNFSIILLET